MLRQTKVVSISLPPNLYWKLEEIRREEDKSRSELIRFLLNKYEKERNWQKVFDWGKATAEKFNIKTEDDILRIIND